MTNKTGIIEKIEDFNLEISGKRFFALPNVRPYLKNFSVGDTVEFSVSKGDKGAISFLKAGHVTGSQMPKDAPKEPVSPPAPAPTTWPENPDEVLQGKPTEVQREWARQIVANPTGVPDQYVAKAREILKKPEQETSPPATPVEALKKKWDEVEAHVKAMHPEDRVQWAMKILEDMHGVPDRIITLARLAIQQKEEGDRIAEQAGGPERKPERATAKADNSSLPTGKVESPVVPAERVVVPGAVESVTIGATINLGNYNNVKLEVTANTGESARSLFQREIQPAIDMVQGIIRQIGKGEK